MQWPTFWRASNRVSSRKRKALQWSKGEPRCIWKEIQVEYPLHHWHSRCEMVVQEHAFSYIDGQFSGVETETLISFKVAWWVFQRPLVFSSLSFVNGHPVVIEAVQPKGVLQFLRNHPAPPHTSWVMRLTSKLQITHFSHCVHQDLVQVQDLVL